MTFGDLRALLQRPGPVAWRHLTDLVNAWPDPHERDEVLLPYCLDHLARWPDPLRAAPSEWLTAAIDDAPPPALSLCAALTIHAGHALTREPDALLDLHLPALRHLRVQTWSLGVKRLRRLLDAPLTAHITRLDLYDQRLREPEWLMLLAWPRLRALTHLGLERCRLTPAHEVREAAGAGALVLLARLLSLDLPALTSLNLRDNQLREDDMEAIASARVTANLRTLLLGARPADPSHADRHAFYNRAGRHGVHALATGPSLARLEALELSYHQLDDAALRPLFDAPPRALKQLDLHLNHLRSASGLTLAASALLPQLDALDLSGNPIGANAVTALLTAHAPHLRHLRLSRTSPGRAGLKALLAAKHLAALTHLHVADDDLITAQLVQLVAAYPQLQHLDLSRNVTNVEPAAIDALLTCRALRTVQLGACDDAHAQRLMDAVEALPDLERVRFAATSSNDAPAPSGPRPWLRDRLPAYRAQHFLSLSEPML